MHYTSCLTHRLLEILARTAAMRWVQYTEQCDFCNVHHYENLQTRTLARFRLYVFGSLMHYSSQRELTNCYNTQEVNQCMDTSRII
jgi:hypothetical protein